MKNYQKTILTITIIIIMALAFPTHASAAPVVDDRTIFGESYTLESGRILDGDLNVIGGVVNIEKDATVDGNVFVVGGLVTIDGVITGDLIAFGGTVNLEKNAVIEGDVISPASFINQETDAIIEGDRIEGWTFPWRDYNRFDTFRTPRTRLFSAVTRMGRILALTLILAALGALLLLILPKPVEVMERALEAQPWLMLGYGALTAFVMLVGGILFSITICLIPVVILVGLAVALAVLVGWLTLGYLLGKKISEGIFNTTWNPVLAAAVGNLVLYLIAEGLDLIPCLGGFLVFFVMLFGLGMAVVTLFGTRPYPQGLSPHQDEKVILFKEKQAEVPEEMSTEDLDQTSQE